jgi:choline dehydrogenase-like flavoprotein
MIKGVWPNLWHYVNAPGILLGHVSRDLADAVAEKLGNLLLKSSGERTKKLQGRDRTRSDAGTHWFVSEEAALVEILASVIVPSEQDSPGAREIDVLGLSVVEKLDSWIAAAPDKQFIYSRGLVAFDELANRIYGCDVVGLTFEEQLGLIKFVDDLRQNRSKSASIFGKLKKRFLILSQMWDGSSPAVDLFPIFVQDILAAFYTSEVSWIWLGYDGPPMPYGYEDLHKPRPPKRKKESEKPLEMPESRSELRSTCSINLASKKEIFDVVVIGSGAGGAVVAKELGESGISVAVLEAGKRYNPYNDYLTDRSDFELKGRGIFEPQDDRRDVYTTGGANGFSYNRTKGVGGSTLQYAAMSPRLHESDFRVRSEDGIADDWPISYTELSPYYTRVEYELGIAGPQGAEANPFDPPRTKPYPTPPHGFNMASLTVKRGADALGLHFVREPVAIPSKDWNGRPACIGAGTCHMGCLISAKSSMDVTYVPKAEATGRVSIRSQCTASEIILARDGKARSVVYFDKDGSQQEISARAIVLAANAVETPRLLLLSKSNQFPHGLANSSGLVGKYFTEHLAVFAYGLFSERVDPWRGIPTGGMIQDYYATDQSNSFARGWTVIVTSNSHWPLSVAKRIRGWGVEHKKGVETMFGHSICLASIGEQLPDLRNQVTLDPFRRDAFDLPVPRLTNEPRNNDRAMIKTISASLKAILEAAGASSVWGNQQVPGMSSHYLGTCRMGSNSNKSVVNEWGRTHDVPNLFIADGSVFVTGGAVNPALTISALATRTAEHIVRAFGRREI